MCCFRATILFLLMACSTSGSSSLELGRSGVTWSHKSSVIIVLGCVRFVSSIMAIFYVMVRKK